MHVIYIECLGTSTLQRYLDVNTSDSKHHVQLGPDDSVSFPTAKRARCCLFYFHFEVIKEILQRANKIGSKKIEKKYLL